MSNTFIYQGSYPFRYYLLNMLTNKGIKKKINRGVNAPRFKNRRYLCVILLV